ncbi:MAG: hypothetical protein D6737_19795 [Chloroflexi bacterium]|nr:MAG: hypothetical protein D6737_19795 [Chloroflexota bacterium]
MEAAGHLGASEMSDDAESAEDTQSASQNDDPKTANIANDAEELAALGHPQALTPAAIEASLEAGVIMLQIHLRCLLQK